MYFFQKRLPATSHNFLVNEKTHRLPSEPARWQWGVVEDFSLTSCWVGGLSYNPKVMPRYLGGETSHIFFIFSLTWKKWSNLTIIFFRWVGSTTNQMPTYKVDIDYMFFSIKNPTHPWHSKSLKPSRNPETPFFFLENWQCNQRRQQCDGLLLHFCRIHQERLWMVGFSPSRRGSRVGNFCPPNFRGGEISCGETKEVGFFTKPKTWNKNPWKSIQTEVGEKQKWIQYFLGIFHAEYLGFHDPNLTYHIFQMGWNHQL